MKNILTLSALVLSVGLLTGCGDDESSSSLSIDGKDVSTLEECANDLKTGLDTVGDNGNKPFDAVSAGNCYRHYRISSEITQAEHKNGFDTFVEGARGEDEDIGFCKWFNNKMDNGEDVAEADQGEVICKFEKPAG